MTTSPNKSSIGIMLFLLELSNQLGRAMARSVQVQTDTSTTTTTLPCGSLIDLGKADDPLCGPSTKENNGIDLYIGVVFGLLFITVAGIQLITRIIERHVNATNDYNLRVDGWVVGNNLDSIREVVLETLSGDRCNISLDMNNKGHKNSLYELFTHPERTIKVVQGGTLSPRVTLAGERLNANSLFGADFAKPGDRIFFPDGGLQPGSAENRWQTTLTVPVLFAQVRAAGNPDDAAAHELTPLVGINR